MIVNQDGRDYMHIYIYIYIFFFFIVYIIIYNIMIHDKVQREKKDGKVDIIQRKI